MPTGRRRARRSDPLASPDAVRAVIEELGERLPEILPEREADRLRFLYAVRHVERYAATDSRRGRRGRWKRDELVKAASALRGVLQRASGGRVSPSTFVGSYLPLLKLPVDITRALAAGDINIFEAHQLARLTSRALGCTSAEARNRRAQVLSAHLSSSGSRARLHARVKELLGLESPSPSPDSRATVSRGMAHVLARVDELLEADPSDSRHVFWEELKTIFYALVEVQPEDLDDATLDEMLAASGQLMTALHRVNKKREARERKATLRV